MADVRTISLTVEGRQISVPDGTSILEAAKTAGVLIPHYCYHPGLPVAGVCRMCLVEVEKAPKLAPACATSVTEGQIVHVHSEKAREARKGVLECLLINHPLDCPICDQSGECELQDYTFQEGRRDSRLRDPKRFNPVEDFGGDVIYVPNRCILCTRCVRFMEDVAQDAVLTVAERGDRALIGKFPERDLTHPWSGNVIDLCPVGALLSKDFLNKARAWELDRTASVCPNCTQGCNTIIETRDNVVVRMRPRPNPDVNGYFLCDYGRLNYRWLNRKDRLTQPFVRTPGATDLVATEWDVALAAAAAALRGRRPFVVASPMLSNESLYLLSRLISSTKGTGVFHVAIGEEAPLPGVADLALRAERAANVCGAERLGFRRADAPMREVRSGDVLVLADDLADAGAVVAVPADVEIIVLATAMAPAVAARASIALPMTNCAEEEGTFTNVRGRVQRFLQAMSPPENARPGWSVLTDLLTRVDGAASDGFALPSDVFDALARDHADFRGLSYQTMGLRGLPVLPQHAVAGA